MSEIKLTPEAFQAVISSVFTGPNCTTKGSLKGLLISRAAPKSVVSLSSLRMHFDEGPDGFIVAYVATNPKFKRLIAEGRDITLESFDIAVAYCLDHIAMVWVAEAKFKEGGESDPYFAELVNRGFVLREYDLPVYLYSCIGKPGRVTHIENGFGEVQTNHCLLWSVSLPEGVKKGDWVVVHFSTAIASLTRKEAKEIQVSQQQNKWYKRLIKSCPMVIDYKTFCGGDLSEYARKQLELLQKTNAPS